MERRIPMNLIVAAGVSNMGIGKNGKLPWPRLPNESKYFQKITTRCRDPGKRNAVIIGRKTWESIPAENRPLKNRLNVIISRTLDQSAMPEGVFVFSSFDDAMQHLTNSEISNGIETIWNIGGRDIYQLGLGHPNFKRLYITRILKSFDYDVFFPDTDWSKLRRINDPDVPPGTQEENGIKYFYEVFQRIE